MALLKDGISKGSMFTIQHLNVPEIKVILYLLCFLKKATENS